MIVVVGCYLIGKGLWWNKSSSLYNKKMLCGGDGFKREVLKEVIWSSLSWYCVVVVFIGVFIYI